ncbi:MAG: fibronectin type III domain-containing protein, partial [Dehalococcoidia bacterium]|nr:fibronectin type III domain-containing protein [Dehalococcoidia bacterium]
MRFNRSLVAPTSMGPKALLLASVCALLMLGGEAQAQAVAPAAPTGLTAASVSHDSVTLSWDEPEDSSITGYRVLRRSRDGDEYGDGEGAAEFIAIEDDTRTSATTYTDDSVTAWTRYVYRVKAINSVGTSGQSGYLNVETAAGPTPPAAPTGLTASSVSHDSVTLIWDDPGNSTITGYQVLRRSRDGDEYGDGEGAAEFTIIVEDTGSSAATYTDTSVTPRTRYVYRVKAINPSGTSGQSGYLNAETPEAPIPIVVETPTPTVPLAPTGLAVSTTTHDSVTLTWDDPGDSSITGYQVLRRSRDSNKYGDGLGAEEFTAIADNTGTSTTTYTDTSVTART